MSSKVSKSEKTKLKFAQSNINHVYRGNTAEPHHKPTVRQYGMQVVGKVQGTRRLPPPAWVPSIKAETGGLDSRVSIVPPGGSGWGAPTESRPTASTGATTEVGSTAVAASSSSLNGSLSREAIGTSFEPAYARSLGSKSLAPNNETPQTGLHCDPSTDSLNHHGTAASVGSTTAACTGTLSQSSAWTSKPQTTVASGGLAANKPFFQRPPPVASSTTTTTSSTRTEEKKPLTTQASGGASEIVGEPTGWAAVTEEEPNFDERILFSDEEESQEDSKSTLKSSTSVRATAQSDTTSTPSAPTSVPSAKQSTPVSGAFTDSEPISRTEPNRPYSSSFGCMSSSVYNEAQREKAIDTWSNTDIPSSFAGYDLPTACRLPTTLPFVNPALGAHCNTNTDGDRVLAVGQYIQPPIPSQGVNPAVFTDPYFPNQIATSRIGGSGGGLLDSILPPTDAETELQNAQRQARTQEFRSAVERARISRQPREAFSTEGDSLLQKSVVNLISEPCDSSHSHNTHAANQSMLLSPGHSIAPPVLGGVMPQQMLLSNTYQQNTVQNRPTLAAAATAAAMVCSTSGASARLSTPGVAPNLVKVPHSQPIPVSSHSGANIVGSWQGPTSLPPNIPTSGFTNPKPPTVPQVLQSALSMAASGAPGAHPNGVYLNPDFFVERLLEILNQQQVVRPQSNPQSAAGRTLPHSAETIAPNSAHELSTQAGQLATPNKGPFGEGPFTDGDLKELSQQMESTLKTESPTPMQNVVPTITDQASVNSSMSKQQSQQQQQQQQQHQQQTQQQQPKRVPELMDVKVPTSTSKNLAYLWERDDYLCGPSTRGGRGRSKPFTSEKSRGGSRGRRPAGRFASDDINIIRMNSGDHRAVATHGGSQEEYEGVSNIRSWRPKTSSKRVFNGPKLESENPLTSSDIQLEVTHSCRSDAKPSYGSEPEEYTEGIDSFQEDPVTSNRRYDASASGFEASSSHRQTSGGVKQRSKPPYSDVHEGDSNGQRRNDYSRPHDRVRRVRGGSGVYYSRTFNSEEGSGKYSYNAEQKPYPRTTRGGSSNGGSGTFPTRSHRSATSTTHSDGNTRRRNLEDPSGETFEREIRSAYTHGEEYQVQRSTRDNRYHDREWRSYEPVEDKNYHKGRGHSRTLDIRRSSAYRDEYNLSDSEPRTTDSKRNHTRQYHSNQRNRSHDDQRHIQKSSTRQVAQTHAHETASSQSADLGENQPQPVKEKPATYDVHVEEYGESDLPTVRVPPMDTTFRSSRIQYTRATRPTTFQRGSGPRRIASNRTSGAHQQQQQSKRSTGSNIQGSRRYRDPQNRYRDDKDGDGGAAAGGGGSGAGRSAVGGNGTSMHSSGGSGANGVGDLGDNQHSGGTHNKGSSNDAAQDRSDLPSGNQYPTTEKPESLLPADAESNENNTTTGNAEVPRLSRHVSGASGPSEGHGVHAVTGGVCGRKDRASNVSTSGGRPSGGQGFRRQGFIRSGHVTASRSNTIASIPPLMSITPEGPFTRTSRDFDTVFNSEPRNTCRNDNLKEKEPNSSVTKTEMASTNGLTLPDSSTEDPEDQEFLSDGFTKVVSKSSKKQARRRLQKELAASTTPNVVQRSGARRSDDSKSSGTHAKLTVNDRVSALSERSPHSSLNVRSKHVEPAPSVKQLLSKAKPFPVKPTFMGPPMCLTNGKVLGSTENARQLATEHGANEGAKVHQPVSAVQGVGSDKLIQTAVTSNTNTERTWSKVVGTKAPPSVSKETVSDKSPSPKSRDWLTKHQLTDEKIDASLNELAANDRNTTVGISEPIKPVWSASATVDEKETLGKGACVSTSEETNVTPVAPSVSSTSTSSSTNPNAGNSLTNSTVVTNVCKVRPQQQQPSPQVGATPNILSAAPNASLPNVTPLSPTTSVQEQNSTVGTCSGDPTAMENDRVECNFDVVASQGRSATRQMEDGSNHTVVSSRPVQSAWAEGLPTQVPGNYFEGRMGYENPFSTNTWPVADLDPIRGTNMQSHYGQLASDALFASPSAASLSTDLPNKPTHAVALAPRHQPYSVQPYNHTSAATADAQHISGVYGSTLGDAHKLSSANPLSQPPHTAFTPMGGSMYVPPQPPSSNPQSQQTGSFTTGWSVPSNAQAIAHGPRFRQRIAHQLDMSSFGGYPFPAEIPNEYAFLPSVTACVPAPPSGGLYSAVQGQPQSNYHHGSTRSTLGTSGAAPWSLLGNSSGAGGMQVSNNDYSGGLPSAPIGSAGGSASGGSGGGLLPHPVAPGFSNPGAPISSSPGSTYMTHPNYVGVIGGGRPSSNDLPGTARQRGLPQGLYPTHNLAHSPSAQGQQQFQLHSTFYPSLSPSHQRVHLQQFAGAQGRNNIHNFANPQSNLYATTYGPPPTQPTPPPLHSQIGYANNFSAESSVAPPGAFHSNVQSHSFSNLGLQPTHPHVHGHRSLQSTGPQMVSRNLGTVNNHGGSALVIPGAVGPSGVSALPGYPQPTPPAPLSVSGYPLKPVLPTL